MPKVKINRKVEGTKQNIHNLEKYMIFVHYENK